MIEQRRNPPLDIDYILSKMSVNIMTGECIWKDASKYHPSLVGKPAGTIKKDHHYGERVIIRFNSLSYSKSLIVFAVANGKWPDGTVDHIDGNSMNDSISNLREVSILENNWNARRRTSKFALPVGVRKINSKFQARMSYRGKTIYLGIYETPQKARDAYELKKKELCGEYVSF